MNASPDPNEEVRELLRKHVPEVAAGAIGLVIVAREAGRVMVAVSSRDSGVHPVAACARPGRLNSISRELGGEKVAIVLWSESAEDFIRSALPGSPGLGPIRTPKVTLNAAAHKARVEVDRKTMNYLAGDDACLRLVSKFVGWDIQLVCND